MENKNFNLSLEDKKDNKSNNIQESSKIWDDDNSVIKNNGFTLKFILIFILLILIFILFIFHFIKNNNLKDDKINLFNKYKYNYFELDNGLKLIILKRNEQKKNDYISISVNTGSIDDDKFSGATHILEHLIFRSSKDYKYNDLNDLISKYSGYFNAQTEFNQTTFYCDFNKDGLNEILKAYLSFILNSKLNYNNYIEELKNVNSELNMSISGESEFYIYEFIKTLFIKNANIKNDGFKIHENENDSFLKNMYNHINKIYQKFYKINNIAITIITNKNEEDLKNEIIKLTENYSKETILKNKLTDDSIIAKENLGKLFYIKNDVNINKITLLFELDLNIIEKSNYLNFLFLLLKDVNKNSFFYELYNKNNYINKINYDTNFVNADKTILNIEFTVNKNHINKYEFIIQKFYQYIEFLLNCDLKTIYEKFYKISKYNNKINIDNSMWIKDYFLEDEGNIATSLSKFILNTKNEKNILDNIKKYHQIWDKNFEEKNFKKFLKKNFQLKNTAIIYTSDSDLQIKDNILKEDEFNTQLSKNYRFKEYKLNINNTSNSLQNYEVYNNLKLKSDFYFYSNCSSNDKSIHFNLEKNIGDNLDLNCINKQIMNESNYDFKDLTDTSHNFKFYYKKYIGFKNQLINLKLEIFSLKLINKNLSKNEKMFWEIFKIYMNNYFVMNYYNEMFTGLNYDFINKDYSFIHNINIDQNNIIDKINFILNILKNFNFDIFKKSKDIYYESLKNTKTSNLFYSIYNFNEMFEIENNYNIFINDDYDKNLENEINSLEVNDFKTFITELYQEKSVSIFITGNIDNDSILEIKSKFNNMNFNKLNYDLNNLKNIKWDRLAMNFGKDIKINKKLNTKDNNKIYIKKYYFKINSFKDYFIGELIKNNFNDQLYNTLRVENKVGYVVSFDFNAGVNISSFSIIISGDRFNRLKHEALISECYKKVLEKFLKMENNKLKELIKIKYDKILEIPNTLESFSNEIYIFQNYKSFLNFKNLEMPAVTINDIENHINNNIINNQNNILLEL